MPSIATHEDVEQDVITAIEANGTDVASRGEFDVDAIVNDLLDRSTPTRQVTFPFAVTYDGLDDGEFWKIVAEHVRT